MSTAPLKDMTKERNRNRWPRLRTKFSSSFPLLFLAPFLPSPLLKGTTITFLSSLSSSVSSLLKSTAKSSNQLVWLVILTYLVTSFNPVHGNSRQQPIVAQIQNSPSSNETPDNSIGSQPRSSRGMLRRRSNNDFSVDMSLAETRNLANSNSLDTLADTRDLANSNSQDTLVMLEEGRHSPAQRGARRRRQADSSSTTTSLTPASITTTACICPSSTSTTAGAGSTSTTLGTTTTEGECICPGQTDTTIDIEVETSTALPISSNEGRQLRQELLDMENDQFKSKFETKLFKNIPFLKLYL